MGWNRLFKGFFLAEIEFKWLHERLNQTLVCRAAKLKLWCNLSPPSTECIKQPSPILGLQPRDKAAMLRVHKIEFFLKNLHENRVKLPEERNAFVLDLQYGRRDLTCKPAMAFLLLGISPSTVTGKKPLPGLLIDILLSKVFPLFFLAKDL